MCVCVCVKYENNNVSSVSKILLSSNTMLL